MVNATKNIDIFNLAHELLNLQSEDVNGLDGINHNMMLMKDKISHFLDEQQQLDL